MIYGLDVHKLNVIYKNIDELIEEYGVEEVESVLNEYIQKKKPKICDSCICKTCAIAEVNGGAPGCGDCYKCSNSGNYEYHCNSCNEYYNTDEPKGMSIGYICCKKMEEESENNN